MRSSALFVTLVYLVFGILWITVSGEVVKYFTKGADLSLRFEFYKGIFFILSTSLLLYFLIKKRESLREKLESDITESEAKWKNIFNSANDPILILDKDYRII